MNRLSAAPINEQSFPVSPLPPERGNEGSYLVEKQCLQWLSPEEGWGEASYSLVQAPSYQSTYTYDFGDQLLVTRKTTIKGAGCDKVGYRYNENGQLLDEIECTGCSDSTGIESIVSYTYDNEGKLVAVLEKRFFNGKFRNNTLCSLMYVDSRPPVEKREYYWSSKTNGWVHDRTIARSLLDGQIQEETAREQSSDGWEDDERWLHTYNAAGNLTETVYQRAGTSWRNAQKVAYTYDSNGRLLSYVNLIWTDEMRWDTVWTLFSSSSYLCSYKYDDSGNVSELIVQEPGLDRSWMNRTKYVYTYKTKAQLPVAGRRTSPEHASEFGFLSHGERGIAIRLPRELRTRGAIQIFSPNGRLRGSMQNHNGSSVTLTDLSGSLKSGLLIMRVTGSDGLSRTAAPLLVK